MPNPSDPELYRPSGRIDQARLAAALLPIVAVGGLGGAFPGVAFALAPHWSIALLAGAVSWPLAAALSWLIVARAHVRNRAVGVLLGAGAASAGLLVLRVLEARHVDLDPTPWWVWLVQASCAFATFGFAGALAAARPFCEGCGQALRAPKRTLFLQRPRSPEGLFRRRAAGLGELGRLDGANGPSHLQLDLWTCDGCSELGLLTVSDVRPMQGRATRTALISGLQLEGEHLDVIETLYGRRAPFEGVTPRQSASTTNPGSPLAGQEKSTAGIALETGTELALEVAAAGPLPILDLNPLDFHGPLRAMERLGSIGNSLALPRLPLTGWASIVECQIQAIALVAMLLGSATLVWVLAALWFITTGEILLPGVKEYAGLDADALKEWAWSLTTIAAAFIAITALRDMRGARRRLRVTYPLAVALSTPALLLAAFSGAEEFFAVDPWQPNALSPATGIPLLAAILGLWGLPVLQFFIARSTSELRGGALRGRTHAAT